MPEVFIKKIKFILLLGLFLFAACQNSSEKDTDLLKKDVPATAEITRVNQLIQQGQYLSQNDIDSLKKIREKYPHAPNSRLILQSAYIRREDWQTAADFIIQIPENERTESEKMNLAKILLKLGRYEETLQTVNPLLEKNPSNIELVSFSSASLFYLGRYTEAAEQLDKVWNEIIAARKSDEVTIRGMIWFYQKNYDKALETLNKAVELNPDNIPAFNALVRVYGALGNNEKAEEYAKKVQFGFDRMTAGNQKKARFVENAKKLEEAFQAKRFEEVVTLSKVMIPDAETPNKYALYQYLANAYQALGKTTEAQDALAEAEKLKK